MYARVFTLRVHSDCTSNLLILFERVDKTAVELFIVRGTSENDVLASLTANNCCTGRLSSRAFYPSSELSSHCIFHRVAFFLSLLTHSSIVSFFYDLAHADNSIFPSLQETRPRLAYLRVTVRLFENHKSCKNQEKSNGLVSTNHKIHDEAMSLSRAFVANN